MLLIIFLIYLSPLAHAREIASIFIGAGPTVNMSEHPRVTFLKDLDGLTDLGILYEVKDKTGNAHSDLQMRDPKLLAPALAAMLYQQAIMIIQEKLAHLGGVANEDALYLANQLLANAGPEPKIIKTLPDCHEVMTYLSEVSNTVYPSADLAAIQPLFCDK